MGGYKVENRKILPLIMVYFIIPVLFQCRLDHRLEDPTKRNVRIRCITNAYRISNLCDDEKKLLDWAASYPAYKNLNELTREVLQKVTRQEKDINKATALFYHRVITEPRNKIFLDDLERREKQIAKKLPNYSREKVLLAMAPGMFYKDNPEVGADGRILRALARKIGLMEALIPVPQDGTVEENGEIICKFIRNAVSAKKIILTSVSKAGGDVKIALEKCGDKSYFKKVIGWYNVGGINRGSVLINRIESGWRSRWEARIYFFIKGYNYQGMRSLRAGKGAPLEGKLQLPKHVRVVNVVGVPFERHVTKRARPFFKGMLPYGPNDGLSLNADSIISGGAIYPAFRNDHYFRWPMPENRILAFLSYLVEKN